MSASSNILQFPIAQPGWVEVIVTEPAPAAKAPEPIDLGMLPPEPSTLAALHSVAHTVACAVSAIGMVIAILAICIGAHP